MVKIRLTRGGTKKSPFYRVIAIDSRKPRSGRASEFLGIYHPVSRVKQLDLKEDAILAWLDKGAQPSDTVGDILKKAGILQKHNAKVAERAKEKRARAKAKKAG